MRKLTEKPVKLLSGIFRINVVLKVLKWAMGWIKAFLISIRNKKNRYFFLNYRLFRCMCNKTNFSRSSPISTSRRFCTIAYCNCSTTLWASETREHAFVCMWPYLGLCFWWASCVITYFFFDENWMFRSKSNWVFKSCFFEQITTF